MPTPRLRRGETALLIVDLQEKLTRAMLEPTPLLAQAGRLIDGANILDIPITVTEQYPAGLGPTVGELAARLQDVPRHEKRVFSSCIEPVMADLQRLNARTVLVAGIEAHVCVLHTALDLLDAGYQPAIVCNAIASRRSDDTAVAIDRMTAAGAIPVTVESALLELLGDAAGDEFKAILNLIK